MTEDGTIWAYDAFNGSEAWHQALPGDAIEKGGPIVIGDHLIAATRPAGETSIISGLDAASGAVLWEVTLADRVFSPFAYSDSRLVVGGDLVRALQDELIFADGFH